MCRDAAFLGSRSGRATRCGERAGDAKTPGLYDAQARGKGVWPEQVFSRSGVGVRMRAVDLKLEVCLGLVGLVGGAEDVDDDLK